MSATPKVHYLKDYTVPDFLIDTVHLHFELGKQETVVTSVLTMRRNLKATDQSASLVLNGESMELRSIELDGKALAESQYMVDKKTLTVVDLPAEFILETQVEIKPQENTLLMGLYKSGGNFCTQCESQGFRRITYYLDRPDVMAQFTTTISADKNQYPMLLSNGNLVETRELENNRHWVHWQDPSKKPSYLFALVAGDFDLLTDSFTTMSGRNIDLRLYLEKGFKDQGDFALTSLKHAMQWDEEAWGREYDLDIYMIVAVSDFNMGAMENKGLNIFNTKYILAKPETATDQDYVGIENVIGHEYFHNWSGNRITCRDWFQITLKEGLTVFRDQSFIEDMTSKGVMRISHADVVRTQQFAEDASPMAHPIRPDSYVQINNFYTLTVYRKGSEVIRMIQTLLTPPVFRQGMDLYFQKHDGQAVTTEDFVGAMSEASNRDLTQFKNWYNQAGTPTLTINSEYNADKKTFTINVEQATPATPNQTQKKPFHIPLAVGLVAEACEDLPLQLKDQAAEKTTTAILELTEPKQSFTFINVASKPTPSLLRGFSAPVKINYAYSDTELAHLWRCDSDSFSRFNAGQRLMMNAISQLVKLQQAGKTLSVDAVISETFTQILTLKHDDLNMQAKLLSLPNLKYLMAQINSADITALFAARKFMLESLAKTNEAEFLKLYQLYADDSAYAYNTEAMGQRSIKNICLSYLMATDPEKYAKLAYQQFSQTDNMTDVMGALAALNNYAVSEREQALNEFYQRWHAEPLVVNKWLGLQAVSSLPKTLQAVQALLAHESFDAHNPNNVYALVCGFGENQICFHDASGAGYHFIAEQALKIDASNSIVAGRILQPLTRWQQVDKKRAELMRAELARIA
ncbi:MAG: aminopeptidase N, partial [Gammaproteobacteria bacterium]|nr:aminopeptidase N [Gammaproteobacteria bacterium]